MTPSLKPTPAELLELAAEHKAFAEFETSGQDFLEARKHELAALALRHYADAIEREAKQTGPDYVLVGLNADGRPCAAMTVRAASAGLEVVKANGVLMLHDMGHKHVKTVEAFAWPIERRTAEDSARLDWLEKNGTRVKFAKGYLGSADSWSYEDFERTHHDADSLRAAIDLASDKEVQP